MKKFNKIIIFLILSLAIGSVIGYFVGYRVGFDNEHTVAVRQVNQLNPIRLNNSYYKFINPILAYATPSATQVTEFADLRNKISSLINSEKQNGLTEGSVYMEELNKGAWVGVNSNHLYPPASMYKVAIMIAYFSAEEENLGLFNEKFIYTKDIDDKIKNSDFDFLHVGTSYEVSDLINKMIIDSDNASELLLEKYIDQNSLNSFFSILGIKGIDSNGYFVISPKQYSLFFRILYNATYLDPDFSEKVLNILSQTTFNDGLVAGVPTDTIVSHKFGQQMMPQNKYILHDCGIIYYPKNPYFLCVMTEGNSFNELKSVIKNISSLVYKNIAQ